MRIIPKPNSAPKFTEGSFSLKPVLQVFCGDFAMGSVKAFGDRANVELKATDSSPEADLILVRESSYGSEQYRLEVLPNVVKIVAADEGGVIAALTTLYLTISEGSVPCYTLDDAPKYGHRGLSLDCVREFFEAKEIKKIIEQLALVKINVFHWHLTDDQGWRIESKKFPKLHSRDGQQHYTQEEILDVVSFAKARGIEVVPEIDLPGHTTAAIAAYPHLSCQGKQIEISKSPGGVHSIIMCGGKESTYEFVFELLGEICDLFESPRIHLGGDEAPKVEWENCEDCKRQLAKIKGETMEDLQGDFTLRVTEFLQKRGKTPVFWNEVLHAREYPKNMEVQFWVEPGNEPSLQAYFNAGGKMVFSDMFYYYLDYSHSMSSVQRVYEYEPRIGEQDCKDAPNTLGLECCMWCERIESPEQLEKQIFPRTIAMAESAWSNQKDYGDFEERLITHLEMLAAEGVAYTPLEESNPSKEERVRQLTLFKQQLEAYRAQRDQTVVTSNFVEFFGSLTKGFQLPVDLIDAMDK